MANESNLRPIKLTHEQAVENGRKGGKASVEAKRRRKAMREYAELLLSLPVADKRKYNKLARLYLPEETIDNEMLAVVGLWMAAVNGDVAAFRELRSVIGEDKEQNTEVMDKLDQVLAEVNEVMKHD